MSAAVAGNTLAIWWQIASHVARARCAGVVPCFMPVTVPVAPSSHQGAPNPARAGTKATEAASGTVWARSDNSAAPGNPRSHAIQVVA